MKSRATEVLLIALILVTGLLLGAGWRDQVEASPRPSGNCGPAAQGLTPEGNVVPLKVDFGGFAIPSAYMIGTPRP